MPILFSGPGGRVVINVPELPKKIRGLKTAMLRGTQAAVRDIAHQYRDVVSNGIRAGALGVAGLEPSTIRARLSGKTAGLTPARPVKRGTKPLFYTGVSSGAVRVLMKSANVYQVSQPENAFIGYSRAGMQDVANMQEKGWVKKGHFTRAMLAYLHIMFRKGDKQAKKAKQRGGSKVGVGYSQTVKARPAWANAWKKLQPSVPRIIQRRWRESLKATGLPITF